MLKYITSGGGGLAILIWIISLFIKKYDIKTSETKETKHVNFERNIDFTEHDDWAWAQFVEIDN